MLQHFFEVCDLFERWGYCRGAHYTRLLCPNQMRSGLEWLLLEAVSICKGNLQSVRSSRLGLVLSRERSAMFHNLPADLATTRAFGQKWSRAGFKQSACF